ncbi:hypothetical protein MIR68_007348 [Amoeboaphelidium protococcarum]|nr:hypothetical protein MIR68_007348 [Amoeboaphelidium protococcarum]
MRDTQQLQIRLPSQCQVDLKQFIANSASIGDKDTGDAMQIDGLMYGFDGLQQQQRFVSDALVALHVSGCCNVLKSEQAIDVMRAAIVSERGNCQLDLQQMALLSDYMNQFIEFYFKVSQFLQFEYVFDLQKDAVFQLLKLFKSLMAQSRLKVAELKVLRILSRNDSIARLMCQPSCDLSLSLAQLLLSCQDSLLMGQEQVNCTAIIANMASITENRRKLVNLRVMDSIISNIKLFRNDQQVLTEICAALSNLALFEDSAKHIVELEACAMLIEIIKDNLSCPELVCQALHVLSNVAKQAKGYIDIAKLMQCLNQVSHHPLSSSDVQIALCNALGSFAFARYDLLGYGLQITDMILQTMADLHDNFQYQMTACFTLAHMSYNESLDADHFSRLQGFQLILNAMKRFQFHKSLQTTACFALGSVASTNELREEFMNLNGHEQVIMAMRTVYSSVKPCQSGGVKKVVTTFHVDRQSTGSEDSNATTSMYTTDLNEDASQSSSGSPKHDKGLPNGLLLQMFASVALMNLSELPAYKEVLVTRGVAVHLYEAAQKVKSYEELYFVLMTIFARFTETLKDHVVYIKPQQSCCMSLLEKAYCAGLQSIYDSQERVVITAMRSNSNGPWPVIARRISPILSAFTNLMSAGSAGSGSSSTVIDRRRRRRQPSLDCLEDVVRQHVPQHILALFPDIKYCVRCHRPIFYKNCIRQYHMQRNCSKLDLFCNEECAEKYDDQFASGERKLIQVELTDQELRW